MEKETLRLHYSAAIACGMLAALTVHIMLTVSGYGLGVVLKGPAPTNAQQVTAALAWWSIGAAGALGGFVGGYYLIAAARSRDWIATLARRFLIAVVLAVCTAAGVLSKTESLGGGLDVLTNLTVLVVAALCAYGGTRFVYLKAARS